MKLPALKHPKRQLTLWETPLGNHGSVRYFVGDLIEEMSANLLGGVRYKTDSTCEYCPDVRAAGLFVECKGVGQSGQAFIYKGRLERDEAFSRQHPLAYLIWHHDAKPSEFTTVEQLRRSLPDHLKATYLIPFPAIKELCTAAKEYRLNTVYGRTREYPTVYGTGYRFPISRLSPFRMIDWTDPCTLTLKRRILSGSTTYGRAEPSPASGQSG